MPSPRRPRPTTSCADDSGYRFASLSDVLEPERAVALGLLTVEGRVTRKGLEFAALLDTPLCWTGGRRPRPDAGRR